MAYKRQDSRFLARTAKEVKNYTLKMRILRVLLGCLAAVVAIIFIIAMTYSRYGSFTMSVDRQQAAQYKIQLSETEDFFSPSTYLNCHPAEITNIWGTDIPKDIDSDTGGEKSTNEYLAYTFFLKNNNETSVLTYDYSLNISDMTKDIDKAMRIRIYVNGVATDYARVSNDGTPEPIRDRYGIVKDENGNVLFNKPFDTEQAVVESEPIVLGPGEITRFTVVIWLEGSDPECTDEIIGGIMKSEMNMKVSAVDGVAV